MVFEPLVLYQQKQAIVLIDLLQRKLHLSEFTWDRAVVLADVLRFHLSWVCPNSVVPDIFGESSGIDQIDWIDRQI